MIEKMLFNKGDNMNNVSFLKFGDIDFERQSEHETLRESARRIVSDASEYDESDRTTSDAYKTSFNRNLLWTYTNAIAQEAEGNSESGSGNEGSGSGSENSGNSGSGSGNSDNGSNNLNGNETHNSIVEIRTGDINVGGCNGPSPNTHDHN